MSKTRIPYIRFRIRSFLKSDNTSLILYDQYIAFKTDKQVQVYLNSNNEFKDHIIGIAKELGLSVAVYQSFHEMLNPQHYNPVEVMV